MRGFVVILAGAFLMGGAATGHAEPLRHVDSDIANPLSDGVRYLTYGARSGALRVRDTARGTSRDVAGASGCFAVDASHGVALVRCDGGEYRVVELASGGTRRLPGARDSFASYDHIGRVWVQGRRCPGHCGTIYRNWHTGADRDSVAGLRDLDGPGLARYDYRRHDSVFVRGPSGLDVYYRPPGLKSRSVLVRRCRQPCLSASPFAGGASWSEGFVGYGFVYRPRRSCAWRAPVAPGARPSTALDVLPTRYEMVVYATGNATLYAQRWARC